jgi:DNA-binding CsgD family transcriptional regulator
MDVLERDAHRAALDECLTSARNGDGRLVFVSGEAGIGKTTLVDGFCAGVRGARVAVGACDALDTPRPLGPLLEIAERLGLTHPHAEVSLPWLLPAMVEALSASHATVAVVEDAHWADEATLDVLRYVGRRVSGLRALLVVTFRDDELEVDHPLQMLLGDLATAPGVLRLQVEALTHAAVAALADAAATDVDVHALYAQTGGNPFFVTEVLAAGGQGIPPSVRDAVLARAARLSPPARAALDAAATVPTRVETWLVDALTDAAETGLDECVSAGMLRADAPGVVAFRHEVARRAIDEALPPARRAALNARAAQMLLDRHGDRADPARIAYHAERAGDAPLARKHATRAARRAADLGSHREAAAQYARAFQHAEGITEQQRADLLERSAIEARILDRMESALAVVTEAVALRRRLGDPRRLGQALLLLARGQWDTGDSTAASESLREAISTLEAVEPGIELARAYASAAAYAQVMRAKQAALDWGAQAQTLAEQLGATDVLAYTLNITGWCKLVNGDPAGADDLRRSIAVATEAGRPRQVAHGWGNLGTAAAEVRDYPTAEPALRTAISLADELDADHRRHVSTAWLARVLFEQGDWAGAVAMLEAVPLTHPGLAAHTRIKTFGVLGRLHARRGDDNPEPLLRQAWELAVDSGEIHDLWPVAASRAEAAWLTGDVDAIRGLVDDTYAFACELEAPWAVGELGLWRVRAGVPEPLPDLAADPWALHAGGRLHDAADAWLALGCPYEAADAQSDSDRPDDLRAALGTFDELGAAVPAARTRRRLRKLGVRGIPRGPQPSTAANPAGLTPRQVEVLGLVSTGLSDADIAARLHLSPKTVGHHVSAILAKLQVSSRMEAAQRARTLGIGANDNEHGSGWNTRRS